MCLLELRTLYLHGISRESFEAFCVSIHLRLVSNSRYFISKLLPATTGEVPPSMRYSSERFRDDQTEPLLELLAGLYQRFHLYKTLESYITSHFTYIPMLNSHQSLMAALFVLMSIYMVEWAIRTAVSLSHTVSTG